LHSYITRQELLSRVSFAPAPAIEVKKKSKRMAKHLVGIFIFRVLQRVPLTYVR
jgi:hypothetical protein